MLADGPMVTLALAAAGVIGTWFVMSYRIRELEKKCARIETLDDKLLIVDNRTRESAASQGARLEKVTVDLAVLIGKVDGIDIGLARRSKTAAAGNPIKAAV